MRATVVYAAVAVRIENGADARLTESTDAVVRVTHGEGQSTYRAGDLGYRAPAHDGVRSDADDGQKIPSPVP